MYMMYICWLTEYICKVIVIVNVWLVSNQMSAVFLLFVAFIKKYNTLNLFDNDIDTTA